MRVRLMRESGYFGEEKEQKSQRNERKAQDKESQHKEHQIEEVDGSQHCMVQIFQLNSCSSRTHFLTFQTNAASPRPLTDA